MLTVSSLPPFAASTLVKTVSPFRSSDVTLVLSLNLNPCFCRIFWKFFLYKMGWHSTLQSSVRNRNSRNLLVNANTPNSTQKLDDSNLGA